MFGGECTTGIEIDREGAKISEKEFGIVIYEVC
jgi:hypothetical protein